MKTIFVYIGTQAGEKSKTLGLLNKIFDKLKGKTSEEIVLDIYTGNNTNITHCKSCNGCFSNGKCILDNTDDIKMLENKILKADLVIFGSPVYAHNISGDMKVFIDRISYWMHLMILAGKPGFIIATSGGNGIEYVNNYLHKIMNYLGIRIIGKLGATVYSLKQLNEPGFLEENIEEAANTMHEYLINNKNIESDQVLETIFKGLKTAMKLVEDSAIKDKSAEYKFWNDSGQLECNSFSELLIKKKSAC